MREATYQMYLIKRIEDLLPGCLVLKNDANYIQGIPDLIVLYSGLYSFLEVKANSRSKTRPNQSYYLKHHGGIFSAFIYPENEEEVLDALQQAFVDRGNACVFWGE